MQGLRGCSLRTGRLVADDLPGKTLSKLRKYFRRNRHLVVCLNWLNSVLIKEQLGDFGADGKVHILGHIPKRLFD